MHNIICTREIKNKFFFHSLDIYLHNIIITTMAHKILLTLLLQLTVAFSAFAQSDNIGEYLAQNSKRFLTVKGLELKPGLRMDDALKAFEAKGWERSEYFDTMKELSDTYFLNGTFYNCSNCNIMIMPIANNKKIVGTIGITLPERKSFKDLKEEYDELKSDLSEKYHMVSSTESFDDKDVEESTSDILKLTALSRNEAEFMTEFHLSENKQDDLLGYIRLAISHHKTNNQESFHVYILYCTYDDLMEIVKAKDDL